MREMKKMREEDKVRAGRVKRVGLLTGGMGGSETLGRETIGNGISGGRRCWSTLWAGGLVDKGSVNLANFWEQIRGSVLVAGGERGMVPNMWVGGDEEGESGMGVVWSGEYCSMFGFLEAPVVMQISGLVCVVWLTRL